MKKTYCNCCEEAYPIEELKEHYNGQLFCSVCAKFYFQCPDCGTLYDRLDTKHGDPGSGYCAECSERRRYLGDE